MWKHIDSIITSLVFLVVMGYSVYFYYIGQIHDAIFAIVLASMLHTIIDRQWSDMRRKESVDRLLAGAIIDRAEIKNE